MSDSDVYADHARAILKAELRRKGIGYAELAKRLTADGSPITTNALANKLSRGGFSAAFLLQALALIDVRTIRLEED